MEGAPAERGEATFRAPSLTFRRARRLRRDLTLPEAILWNRLRRTAIAGLRFRRQHPVGPYILDFYCPEARLAIEVDGAAHDAAGGPEHDALRTAWLGSRGIRVLRFAACDVLRDESLLDVLATIKATAAASD